jgi:hypothetical protein
MRRPTKIGFSLVVAVSIVYLVSLGGTLSNPQFVTWSTRIAGGDEVGQHFARITPSFDIHTSSRRRVHVMPAVSGVVGKLGEGGMEIKDSEMQELFLVVIEDTGCSEITPLRVKRNVSVMALMQRGGCSFDAKVFHAQQAGYTAALIYDAGGTEDSLLIQMTRSDQIPRPIHIPSFFISFSDGLYLKQLYLALYNNLVSEILMSKSYLSRTNLRMDSLMDASARMAGGEQREAPESALLLKVTCERAPHFAFTLEQSYLVSLAHLLYSITVVVLVFCGIIIVASLQILLLRYAPPSVQRWLLPHPLPPPCSTPPRRLSHKQCKFLHRPVTSEWFLPYLVADTPCAICFESFAFHDLASHLPCGHLFHTPCAERWLTAYLARCPLCNMDLAVAITLREEVVRKIRGRTVLHLPLGSWLSAFLARFSKRQLSSHGNTPVPST